MAGFIQYVKDTRGELRHVAWPTRTQTIIYTIFVAIISVATALYLGLFDYLFTSGLSRVVEVSGANAPAQVTQQASSTAPTAPAFSTSTPGR